LEIIFTLITTFFQVRELEKQHMLKTAMSQVVQLQEISN